MNSRTAAAALEMRDVCASYLHGGQASGSRVDALTGASLRVEAGELVAVLGPNGAGKSTLLRVLSGTLRPHAGAVELAGRPLGQLSRREVARELAVVTQANEVAWGFRVADVVMMGRAPHQDGWQRVGDEDRQLVDAVLARCDLTRLQGRRVQELSGGEQKRVAIARALAQRPRVLLLDEPAAFLDVRHQTDLYELLLEEVRREHLACVVVMHDLNTAAQYASRVVLIKDGRIRADGSVPEVMTYAKLREVFDADLYCGVNELTGDRFFLPMRNATGAGSASSDGG